jgi:hypothetical protein
LAPDDVGGQNEMDGLLRLPLLRLDDFSGLDAAGADADTLARGIHLRLDSLKVYIPPATRHVVRVGNVVAELRLFPADFTYLCHDLYPISCKCGCGFGNCTPRYAASESPTHQGFSL